MHREPEPVGASRNWGRASVKNQLTDSFARVTLCRMDRNIAANNDPVYQLGFRDGFVAKARQPLPGFMQIGKLALHRMPSGTLYLTDGVSGAAVDEARLEVLLRHVFENRWHPAEKLREEIDPPLPEMVS